MFIFPDLGGATPNHRLAFPGEDKEAHQKSPLVNKHARQLLPAATDIKIDIHTSIHSFIQQTFTEHLI